MSNMKYQADLKAATDYLQELVNAASGTKGEKWLGEQLTAIAGQPNEGKVRKIYLAFGAAPRLVGKAPILKPSDETEKFLQNSAELRDGFNPSRWTADQAARVCILLQMPHTDSARYLQSLDRLFETADMEEQAAGYLALPLLPHPEMLKNRAAEGIRTNMTLVLDAVALDNPYPSNYLEEGAWNQLVLKSIFTEREVYRIVGGDKRANADLARMLSDYAHERWAAGRSVTPELWRFTGRFLNTQLVDDLEKLLSEGDETEKRAAILTCLDSEHPDANALLEKNEALAVSVKEAGLDWDTLGKAYHQTKQKPTGAAYQQAGSGYSKDADENRLGDYDKH